jgi:hypothetical protein
MMMANLKSRIIPLFFLAACGASLLPASDAQSTAFLSASLAALSGGKSIQDAKLSANVNFVAGSDEESGPATLEASGYLESRVTLNLSGGQRLSIQNGTQAAWSGPDAQLHPQALHNSLNWAAWFFPALAIGGLLQDPSYSASYIGLETYAGSPAQHLRIVRLLPGRGDPATMALLLELTTADLYLDSSTLLPLALLYNIHPDNNALQNIPVKVQFANYQSTGGVQSPFHILQFLQGSPLLDIALTSVAINPSLPPGDFAIE